jgi:hypothetical protein
MRILTVTMAAAFLTVGIAAQPDKSLPPFTAVSASGAAVPSNTLNNAEHWLLVYVAPQTVVGERMLRSLDDWAAADGARVVVIAAGAAGDIDAKVRPLLTKLLPAAGVYADPDGSVARALGLKSIPALVGVSGGAVDWIVQGVLNDPRMVEPVVRSWLGRP